MQKSSAVYDFLPGINSIAICVFLAVTAVLTFSGPAAAIDNTPPEVVSTTPSNGTLGVSAGLETIVITFTEPMAAATNYTYSPNLGSHTFQWSDDRTRLTLARVDPDTPLVDDTIIHINLNPYGSTNFMEDMAGNHLPAYSFSFTTGQSNPLAPVVVGTQPANGAWGLSRNLPSYSVTFDKPMQPGTCDQLSTHGDQWGSVTKSWSPDGRTVTYTRDHPETQLRSGAIFTVTLNPEPCTIIFYRDMDDGHKLGTYSFSFTTAIKAPTVVSSSPAHQAVDVSPDLDTITVNFSETMADAVSFTEISKIWGSSTYDWSSDHRSLSITRDSAALPLPEGGLVTLVLNPSGAMNFQDIEGNLLDTSTLSFTVAGDPPYQVARIGADPGRGFYWPYYLCVPHETAAFTTLLVEPNNTGTVSDDLAVHETAAADLVTWRSMFAAELQVPLMVPVFPRPAFLPGMYTHALDRATLLSTIPDYIRIDLQLIAMIEDARQRLAEMGHRLDSRVFMMGFSASGAFTSRFTAIHPEIVRAAAPGSPGGWPLAPVASWDQIPMYYPVGHFDLEALTGVPVKLNLLRKVPQYIYVGGLDRNDALDTRAFPEADRQAICDLLDCGAEPLIADRWSIAEQMHVSVNILNTFVVYPGIAHTISAEMVSDLLVFFEAHKPSGTGINPSIPLLLLGDP